MANILYRGSAVPSATNNAGAKNAALTNIEIDQNFYSLDLAKFEKSGGTVSGDTTFSNNVTISGNLTINGTSTTINTATLSVDDINITLGDTASPTNALANGGGITLKGTTDKTFNWYTATSAWTSSEHIALAAGKNILIGGSTSGTITLAVPAAAGTNTITFPALTGTVVTSADTGTVTNAMLAGSIANGKLVNSSVTINNQALSLGGSVTLTTDNVGEGSSNLYFTNARARAAISTSGSLGYNATTGVLSYTTPTTDGISEGSNLYFTTARARAAVSATGSLAYNATTGVFSYSQGNTDTVSEGSSNLYFTTARARASIGVSGSLGYNATTGVISYSTPNTDGVSEGATNLYFTNARARAAVSFTAGSGGYNSTTGVFTIPTNTNQLTNGASFITSSSDISGNAGSATKVVATVGGTSTAELVRGNMADNDQFRIMVGGAASNVGWVEIATADDGNEAIYVRQYNGVFTTIARTLTLLGSDGNTYIPGVLTTYSDITASGNITANSDIRLKTNIETIENALDKTLQLRGVSYDKDGKHSIGVIAQEVREILPELVIEANDEDKTLSVAYGNMVGVLIEAIKELNAKVENLQNQLANK